MNSILLALQAFTITRREMLIVLRYQDRRPWDQREMEKRYGKVFLQSLLKKYEGYSKRKLATYIAHDNLNIRAIVEHISINEITSLINND